MNATPPPPGAAGEKQHKTWTRRLAQVRNMLLAGVAVIIPMVVTYWVLKFAYDIINGVSAPWLKRMNINFPGLGFVMTLLIVFLLGVMATDVIGRRILGSLEAFLLKVPVVATIYAGVKQVMDTLKTFNTGVNFKRVVFVPYPADDSYMLGFVTGQFIREVDGKEVTNVFLPTAPNPMTGILILVDSDRVVNSDLTMEEATKLILSAGLLPPKRTTSAPQKLSNP